MSRGLAATKESNGNLMAFSETVASKQPSEIKTYRVIFDAALQDAELEAPEMTTGSGLSDITVSGTFFGANDTEYQIKVDTAAAPDKFIWSNDGGSSWSSPIEITGSAQYLEYGISVTFAATTGHTKDDIWSFTAYAEETISTATVTAYQWDLSSEVSREYDLQTTYSTADEAEVALYADGELLVRDTISLSDVQRTLYVQAINDLPYITASDFIVSGSVGWGEIDGSYMVWFQAKGGTDQYTYKVSVVATTSDNKILEADVIIPVEEA